MLLGSVQVGRVLIKLLLALLLSLARALLAWFAQLYGRWRVWKEGLRDRVHASQIWRESRRLKQAVREAWRRWRER